MKVRFEKEKETKRTIRFAEIVDDVLDDPMVGTLYVPKASLKEIGWKLGKKLIVEIKVEE